MLNKSSHKNIMPHQDPELRIKNFDEVATGYTQDDAVREAMRCLNCRTKPCTQGCPVGIHIPDFIHKVAEGDFEGAYQVISLTSSLPAICGRVCPQESQCEKYCVHGIKGESVAIGRLERFVADWHAKMHPGEYMPVAESNGIRVAVIGSGPAGLACAGDLIQMGYDVTIFESLHKPGGVLAYGIPEFRLPKSIVAMEVAGLEQRGVKIVSNAIIGCSMTIDDLFEDGYEAVFVGTGAGLPQFMNIPGENLLGVYSANEYLTRINLMKAYLPEYDTPIKKPKKAVIVGGGNVAMDAARCARRMGAETTIVYRRSMEEMPARREEIEHAMEEGIEFRLQCNPVRIVGDENDYVTGIECVEMELGAPDASGRRRPVVKPGSEFIIDADTVIIAIGTRLNKLIMETTEGIEPNAKGGIGTDENGVTSREGVFAGGDAVTGAATVILAMGAGKKAAASIDEYLKNKHK